MKCYICNSKADYIQQKGRAICDKCFCMLIEKRIRKYARLNKLFRKGDRILVIGSVNKLIIKSILKDLPAELFFAENENKARKIKINKIVVQWTIDDEANEFAKALFLGKRVEKTPEKYIKLLKPVTDKEVLLFAKIKKIKFKPNKKDPAVQKFLDSVEKKHPNIKYNLARNVEMLNRLT